MCVCVSEWASEERVFYFSVKPQPLDAGLVNSDAVWYVTGMLFGADDADVMTTNKKKTRRVLLPCDSTLVTECCIRRPPVFWMLCS